MVEVEVEVDGEEEVLQSSHCEENTPAPSQGPCVSLDSLSFSAEC